MRVTQAHVIRLTDLIEDLEDDPQERAKLEYLRMVFEEGLSYEATMYVEQWRNAVHTWSNWWDAELPWGEIC